MRSGPDGGVFHELVEDHAAVQSAGGHSHPLLRYFRRVTCPQLVNQRPACAEVAEVVLELGEEAAAQALREVASAGGPACPRPHRLRHVIGHPGRQDHTCRQHVPDEPPEKEWAGRCYRPRYLNIQRLNYLWTIRHSSARIAGNLIT